MIKKYEYNTIFEEYVSLLRNILLFSENRPYPLYESIINYNNDTINHYKGLLVWESYKYYKTILEPDPNLPPNEYNEKIGYFVVPEFGEVTIIPNLEYKQTITISFDTYVEPDFDPFQVKIIKTIDWFTNKHSYIIEQLINGLQLSDRTNLYSHIYGITPPIPTKTSYIRRSITIQLRYCFCGQGRCSNI